MNNEIITALSTDHLKELLGAIKKELRIRRQSYNIGRREDFIKSLTPPKSENFNDERNAVISHNRSASLSIKNISQPVASRQIYFASVIEQDWSEIFPADSSTGCFYVYAHVNPGSRVFVTEDKYGGNYGGQPFYIGKGCGNRAYDLNRNQGHGKKIRAVIADGWSSDAIVHVVFSGLSSQKALELEAKLIYFFGTIYQVDRKECSLYNLEVPKTPIFTGSMKRLVTRRQFSDAKGDT